MTAEQLAIQMQEATDFEAWKARTPKAVQETEFVLREVLAMHGMNYRLPIYQGLTRQ